MLLRLFTTAFATRFAERSSVARDDSLERALLSTGVALAATRPRRKMGLALIVAGGLIAWRRRRRADMTLRR